MKKKYIVCLFTAAIGCLLSACGDKPPRKIEPNYFSIEIPPLFPTQLNIPLDNPMSREGVELGRRLFYDGRLSGRLEPDSLMSCYSCHRQDHAFESGLDHPRLHNGTMTGLTGIRTPHSMLPLFNLVFRKDYMWSGKLHANNPMLGSPSYGVPATEPYHFRNLESFVWMMIAAPHEAHGQPERSVQCIASIPEYPPLFKAAFGSDEVTIDRISKAIAQFLRTLISADSKFDRFLRGEQPLNDEEMAGYILFSTEEADCFHCHGGDGNVLFSIYSYSNNGLDEQHDDPGDRSSVSGSANDVGKYLVPSLRNIGFTAPYMHDGRYNSLDEVIDFYSEGLHWSPTIDPLMKQIRYNGVQLTPKEKRQLKAFLSTLNDSSFIKNPAFSNPFSPR